MTAQAQILAVLEERRQRIAAENIAPQVWLGLGSFQQELELPKRLAPRFCLRRPLVMRSVRRLLQKRRLPGCHRADPVRLLKVA